MEDNFFIRMPLPNATAILVLGIVSIPTCCCYGVVGIICSIIALVLAKKAKDLYRVDAENYTESSYKNIKAGTVCAWIGLALSVVTIAYVIYAVQLIGLDALQDPQRLQERLQEIQEMMQNK